MYVYKIKCISIKFLFKSGDNSTVLHATIKKHGSNAANNIIHELLGHCFVDTSHRLECLLWCQSWRRYTSGVCGHVLSLSVHYNYTHVLIITCIILQIWFGFTILIFYGLLYKYYTYILATVQYTHIVVGRTSLINILYSFQLP